MFFRREKPKVFSFDDRLSNLSQFNIQTASKGSGKAAAMRGGCAAMLTATEHGARIESVGVVIGKEIGELVDGGYQKYFLTASGHKAPARAEQLVDLHAFLEDLREGLGIKSFYNEGLGTVNEKHLYDRVADRDKGVPARVWE